ncbi:MAG TPA: glycosyltransferase [Bryobacteraceae bacterium]|jgi:glycosyltransferase involved in cell wall biosynthesis|nr:glycosyltransferase [Bryobacteraceae bacterium]
MNTESSPVRILHVLRKMDRGGAEMRTLDLMRNIDRNRYRFEFCCTSGLPGELDNEIRELGGRLHYIPLDPRFPGRFSRLLRATPFDVVHSHVHYFSGYILRLAAKAGVPGRIAHFRSMTDGHGNNLRRRLQRRLMKGWLNRYATRILGVSEASLESAWGDRWRRDERCEVIYNGIDAGLFAGPGDRAGVRREFQIPGESPLCIHVGRMDEAKNHGRLLRIFEHVLKLRPDSYLILAGGGADGAIERNARTLAADLGIEGRVTFAGTRGDVPRLLAAADLMIFPSLREGLPGAVLEASAAGAPVLASDLPCIVEISQQAPRVYCLSLAATDEAWAGAAVELMSRRRPEEDPVKLFDQTCFAMRHCARAFEMVYDGGQPRLEGGAS